MKLISNFCYSFLIGALICSSGCISPPPKPQRTPLQIRELQSRTFDTSDIKLVMRAVLNALQDDGFIVKNAVTDLGLLTATKERDLAPGNGWDGFWYGALSDRDPRWPKTKQTEANATISSFGNSTRVRISFQEKVIDNLGATVAVTEVDDPILYRDFFTRIDQSIFFQRQKI